MQRRSPRYAQSGRPMERAEPASHAQRRPPDFRRTSASLYKESPDRVRNARGKARALPRANVAYQVYRNPTLYIRPIAPSMCSEGLKFVDA
jgi:hypothetical protein